MKKTNQSKNQLPQLNAKFVRTYDWTDLVFDLINR